MRDLTIVREDTLHETIASYMRDGDHIIADIDEMKSLICDMIKGGYMFAMDRDRLRDAIEDFVYLCQPDDELNKDRLMKSLEYDDEETDEEYEDDYSPRPTPKKVHKNLPETRHEECHDSCQKVCQTECHETVCRDGVCHKISEKAVEEQAVGEQAVGEQAVGEQAVGEQAVEEQAVEEAEEISGKDEDEEVVAE
jgi:hypothetical protein